MTFRALFLSPDFSSDLLLLFDVCCFDKGFIMHFPVGQANESQWLIDT